ncbi:MAG: hypothetical protein KY445_16650, partial [Armatimonadetes bacterium]|nr:hypothetical protein [Armatimonadota bacterium]
MPNPAHAESSEFAPAESLSRDEIKDAELILTAFRTLLLLVIFAAPFVLNLEISFSRKEILLMALASVYNIGMGIASLFP